MALTKTQQTIWEKARAFGSGRQAVALSDEMCAYLVGRIVHDLGLQHLFAEVPQDLPDFFASDGSNFLAVQGVDARSLFERLVQENADADMYFACLATLHKARLKYDEILSTQPIPTLEQVGPRGLLQFGKLRPAALTGFLLWRKWFYDIDNRAGQETGYLFEPIIAYAIGGTPVPARQSPVRRHKDPDKGRQVDCLLDRDAYEFKIRVTIAASGQGRWREELDFPLDCRTSGYAPVLIVLDSTANPKLAELEQAFLAQGGEVYTGAAAWRHLESLAGPTMSLFLERYVRTPIDQFIEQAPTTLPRLVVAATADGIDISVGAETLHIVRHASEVNDAGHDQAPDDIGDNFPG